MDTFIIDKCVVCENRVSYLTIRISVVRNNCTSDFIITESTISYFQGA